MSDVEIIVAVIGFSTGMILAAIRRLNRKEKP